MASKSPNIQLDPSPDKVDLVSISVTEKLAHLSHPSTECCIFKMLDHLRKENEKAYEPSIVAIGPYHRGKANLQQMEVHKLRYLQRLLDRENERSVDDYVIAIRALEEKSRSCYAETISLVSDEFVEMMLLDGIFIIELFRKYTSMELIDEDDHIFKTEQIKDDLRRDLILFENQIPFFILDRLFNITSDSSTGIIDIAINFLQNTAAQINLEYDTGIPLYNIHHLLGLVHDSWCFTFAKTHRNVDVQQQQWEFINSATKLQEAGVEFKVVEGRHLFDIKFASRTLEIPLLSITKDYAESFLKNLVAYELSPLRYGQPTYVCDYIVFMDCLINSSKDVHLLRSNGIIESRVGDDAEVYTVWHKLFQVTMTDAYNFSYFGVFNEVNKYCKQRRNVWMANLKRNYFNSPWALISFLAVVIASAHSDTNYLFRSFLWLAKGAGNINKSILLFPQSEKCVSFEYAKMLYVIHVLRFCVA